MPVVSTHETHSSFYSLLIACLYSLHKLSMSYTELYSALTACLFSLHTAWHTQFFTHYPLCACSVYTHLTHAVHYSLPIVCLFCLHTLDTRSLLLTTHCVSVLSTHTWHTQFVTHYPLCACSVYTHLTHAVRYSLPIVCLFHLHTAWHTVIYSLPTAYLFCLHTAWHTQFLHCLPVLSTLSALQNKDTACYFNGLNSSLDLYSTGCMACWCKDWWQLS